MTNSIKLLRFLLVCGFAITLVVIGRIGRHRPYESVLKRVPAPYESPITPSDRSLDEIKAAFRAEEKKIVTLPKKSLTSEKPYLKGKIAYYGKDIRFGKTDGEWVWGEDIGQLSSAVAETVEEVETVVLRSCQQGKGPDYEFLGKKKMIPSFHWNCELTIIDRTIPAVVHRKKFSAAGKDLMMLDPEIDKFETDVPYLEINKFLGSLPRK